jgi:hypothetical protein
MNGRSTPPPKTAVAAVCAVVARYSMGYGRCAPHSPIVDGIARASNISIASW